MEMSCQVQVPGSCLLQEVGWALDSVSTFWRRKNNLLLMEYEPRTVRTCSTVAIPIVLIRLHY